MPDKSLKIGSLSKNLQRGLNTTRHVELFKLYQESFVADTPGFNRPELKVEPNRLSLLFPEFRNQLTGHQCKFRDCLHRDEPGCGINKDWERYSYYRQFIDELIDSHY